MEDVDDGMDCFGVSNLNEGGCRMDSGVNEIGRASCRERVYTKV